MGTQQLLLLALGVIIVGIAVAVGITMFVNQGYNSNKQALASEMATYPPSAIRFWRAAKLLGGAGGDVDEVTIERVSDYLGFSGANYSQTSPNGEFRIIGVDSITVTLKALGVENKFGKHPVVTTSVNVSTGGITTTLGDATGW